MFFTTRINYFSKGNTSLGCIGIFNNMSTQFVGSFCIDSTLKPSFTSTMHYTPWVFPRYPKRKSGSTDAESLF